MGLVDAIKRFFAAPAVYGRFADLAPGRVILEGDVRTGERGTLSSPLKGAPCVAFFYTARYQSPSRGGALTLRPLRAVEGFHPFGLELDGGRVEAVPRTPGSFTQADHQALAANGYPGFTAEEELVGPRARVQVHGVLKRDGDTWTLTYHRLVRLDGKAGAKKKKPRR